MKNKKCIAMLLAGGQGSRLYALTTKLAKPAVSFGAKYRIIDFPLSNCINSNIDTVGVLTQYQPLILNEYIGNGEPWDLDRANGGVHTLPPYQAKTGGEWYKGTANAIYQNLHFMKKFNPEHILILSGDHIYKMDYNEMLKAHIANDADCTIAVLDVPMEEASRFGIMDYDKDNRVTDFAEKPKQPKSNHASMGIYIFKADVLYNELILDEKNPNSSNDFGKNIIPKMLNQGSRMYGYNFHGYWKDVGTISSLWEANMDLIGDEPNFDIGGDEKKIYSRNQAMPPMFVAAEGSIKNSLNTAGCEIYGTVENSILSEGVIIGKGSVVRNSVLMNHVVVGENCSINYGIIDDDTIIGDNSVIGSENSDKNNIALIGRDFDLPAGTVVTPGQILDKE